MSWLTEARDQNNSFEKGLSQNPSVQNLNIGEVETSNAQPVQAPAEVSAPTPEAPKSWLKQTQDQVAVDMQRETGLQRGVRWLKEDAVSTSMEDFKNLTFGPQEAITHLLWGALSFEASIVAGSARMGYEKLRNKVVSKKRERSPDQILEKVEDTYQWLPGLLPPPKTKLGQEMVKPIGDAFHWLFTGPRKIGKDMAKFYGPNAGWLSEQMLTLGMCRLGHLGGKELVSKVKEITKNAKGARAEKVASELDAIMGDASKSKNPSKYDEAFQKKVNEFEAVVAAEWAVEMDLYERGIATKDFAPAEPGYAKSSRPPSLPKPPKKRIIEFVEASKEAPELSLAEPPKLPRITSDILNRAKKRRGDVTAPPETKTPSEKIWKIPEAPKAPEPTGEILKAPGTTVKESALWKDVKGGQKKTESKAEPKPKPKAEVEVPKEESIKEVVVETPEPKKIKPEVPEVRLSKRAEVEQGVNLETAKDLGVYAEIKEMIGDKKTSKEILTELKKGKYFKEDLKDFQITQQDVVSAIQAVRIAEFKDINAVKYLENSLKKEELKVEDVKKQVKEPDGLERVDPETGRAPGMPDPMREKDLGTSDIRETFVARQKPITTNSGKVIKIRKLAELKAQEQGLIGEMVRDASGEGWRVKPVKAKGKKNKAKAKAEAKVSEKEMQELQKTWDEVLQEDLKNSKDTDIDITGETFDATSWDGLLNILKNERGSVTIDPVDFKKAADFLKAKGMSAKNAMKILKERGISDEFIKAYYKKDGESFVQKMNVEPVESKWLKEGQDAKQLLSARDLGQGRKAPKVTRGDAKIVEQATDVGRPLLGEKIRHMATSEGLMTSLGKPLREVFLRRVMKGEKKSSDIKKTLLEESERLRKTLPIWGRDKISERIDNYAVSRQEGGAARLRAMGKKIVTELTPVEMKIYDRMQDIYKDLYVRINKVRKDSGQKEFPAVKNYSTWIHDLGKLNELEKISMFGKLESIQKGLKRIQGIPSKLDKTGRAPSMKGHEKFRGGPDTPGHLRLDAFENFNQYAMMAGEVLGKTDHIAYLHELLQPKFELYKNAPNTYNFLNEWLDYQKGNVPEMFVTNPKTKKIMSKLSGNVAVSYITFAPRSALVQFSSLNNSITEIGLTRMAEGIAKGLSPAELKRAAKESNALTVRTPETIITDALSGTPTFPGKIGKNIHKVGKTVKKVGIAPLSLSDSIVSYTTWLGAEAKGRAQFKKSAEYKALSGEKAQEALKEFGINFADDVVIRAQGSAAKSARSPIQRTAEGRFVTTLQTFTIANFDYLSRHVLGIKNPDITKPAQVAKIMRWVATSAMISQGFEQLGLRSPIPTPVKAYQEELEQTKNKVDAVKVAATEILEFIPIYGGKYKFGSELSGAVVDQLVRLSNGDMTALPRLIGTPGFSAILKGYRAYDRNGTAADILMGRYIEKPKSRKSSGLSGF